MSHSNPLNTTTVRKISGLKNEPKWMLNLRLEGLESFLNQGLPSFGPDLSDLNLDSIQYYVDPSTQKKHSWEEVPQEIKETFDSLGIPEAEKKILAGVEAQFDSEAIYGSLKQNLKDQGIIFTNIEEGLANHTDLFKKYYGKLVKNEGNKFAALNSAVWSGGSFLYVPKGVEVKLPLQAYFQMGTPNMGQFERTLIIADKGSKVHYVEGCTAPAYSRDALHAGVVEVFVEEEASVRYTTVQNWSKNVYNLVTKKALVKDFGRMSWVDGNIGSKITMKYPACYLEGRSSHGEMLSVAVNSPGQEIHSGSRMVHIGQDTTSNVIAKSLVQGGANTYQGSLVVKKGARNSRAHIQCDSMILSEPAKANSHPLLKIEDPSATVTHEASATKMEEEKTRYIQTRGLKEEEAQDLIISGFLDEIIKELPIEYALEFNKLLTMKIE